MTNPLSKEYDAVVIGGGIAGISTAEIFARSGMKMLLVEKADKLCAGMSGLHNEWFHFCNLDPIFPKNQFLRAMIQGIHEMRLYYGDFNGMNLLVDENGKLLAPEKANAWARKDKLKYVVTSTENRGFDLNNPNNITDFVHKLGMKFLWRNAINAFSARQGWFNHYDWRSNDFNAPEEVAPENLDVNIRQFKNYQVALNPQTHGFVETFDTPLKVRNIVTDLTRSFLAHGGEIRTGTKFQQYQDKDDLKWVLLSDDSVVKTKLIIMAAGSNLMKQVKKTVLVKTVVTPMLLVYPHVCDINLIRLTPFKSHTINHFKQSLDGKTYSVIGSGFFASQNDTNTIETAGFELMNTAKAIFPKIAEVELMHLYYGKKTEMGNSGKRRFCENVIEEIEPNVYAIVAGKFSQAFSLAVNAFKEITGQNPSKLLTNQKNIDVEHLLARSKHEAVLSGLQDANLELEAQVF